MMQPSGAKIQMMYYQAVSESLAWLGRHWEKVCCALGPYVRPQKTVTAHAYSNNAVRNSMQLI
jgi:hypothetical protein